jgi:glycosyltransferase involved in cell wall biosynthesis
MRILIIAYTVYIFDARVKRHAEALAARGDEVDVICLATEADRARHGVNLVALPIQRYRGHSKARYLLTYARFFARASWIAARRSLRRPYDAVIVCSIPDAAILAALAPRLRGSRIILDIHDTMPELYRDKFPGRHGAIGARVLMLEERFSALLADRVIAVHDLHARRLAAAGIPREKIAVVVNAPDPSLFKAPAQRSSRDNTFTLMTHGTVTRRLGLDTVIEGLALLKGRLDGLKLRVLGEGEHWDALRQKTDLLGLSNLVSFEAGVPLEQLSAVLLQASVGIVPNVASNATHLMLPVKMLEYASLGIPIIASRLRTIQHYFPEDAVKYFEPGDPVSFAAAVEHLYRRREELPVLASRAGEFISAIGWDIQRKTLFEVMDFPAAGDLGVPGPSAVSRQDGSSPDVIRKGAVGYSEAEAKPLSAGR